MVWNNPLPATLLKVVAVAKLQGFTVKLLTILLLGISLTLAACGRQPAPKVIPAPKDLQDLRVHKAFKEYQVRRVSPGRRDLKGLRGLLAKRERKAIKATRGIPEKLKRATAVTRETRGTSVTPSARYRLTAK